MDFMIFAPIMKTENFSHYNSALLRIKEIFANSPEDIFNNVRESNFKHKTFFNSVNTVTGSLQ